MARAYDLLIKAKTSAPKARFRRSQTTRGGLWIDVRTRKRTLLVSLWVRSPDLDAFRLQIERGLFLWTVQPLFEVVYFRVGDQRRSRWHRLVTGRWG